MINGQMNKEACRHKLVIENQQLVCEYCKEIFKP
jgi:hypothetical protein